MPEMDGISLLQVLRSYLRWHRLPVILVTGAANEHQLEEAEKLGVRGVFLKGQFRLKDLLACIEQSLIAAADLQPPAPSPEYWAN
jgi:CheY-like chemotaxis protein